LRGCQTERESESLLVCYHLDNHRQTSAQNVGIVQLTKASSTMRSVKVCFLSWADFGYGLTCDEVDGFWSRQICAHERSWLPPSHRIPLHQYESHQCSTHVYDPVIWPNVGMSVLLQYTTSSQCRLVDLYSDADKRGHSVEYHDSTPQDELHGIRPIDLHS
jgi:hypothetical protein